MRSYRVGRVLGIPIEVDLTLLLVLPVLGWLIGSRVDRWVAVLGRLPGGEPAAANLTAGATPWVLGFVAALGLVGLATFNLLLVGIAFFVYLGAAGETRQVELRASLEGVTAGDLMTPVGELRTVRPETPVPDLVDLLFQDRHTGYPVVSSGALVGIVTLEDLREVPAGERGAYRVEDVMTTDLETIRIDENPVDALQRMQQAEVGRGAVRRDPFRFRGVFVRPRRTHGP